MVVAVATTREWVHIEGAMPPTRKAPFHHAQEYPPKVAVAQSLPVTEEGDAHHPAAHPTWAPLPTTRRGAKASRARSGSLAALQPLLQYTLPPKSTPQSKLTTSVSNKSSGAKCPLRRRRGKRRRRDGRTQPP